jgi:hypothetical protein
MIVWDAQEMTCTEQMDRAAQKAARVLVGHIKQQMAGKQRIMKHEDPFRIVIPKMKSITHNEKNCEETTPTIGQPLRAAWPSSGRHSDAFEKPQLFWLVVSHFFPFFLQAKKSPQFEVVILNDNDQHEPT